MSTKPTYEQAQLHLQVYDQRREAKLRQARDWFFKNYHVTSLDDAMRVAPMGSESGAFASMVISYWEQACALLNYDLLHEASNAFGVTGIPANFVLDASGRVRFALSDASQIPRQIEALERIKE